MNELMNCIWEQSLTHHTRRRPIQNTANDTIFFCKKWTRAEEVGYQLRNCIGEQSFTDYFRLKLVWSMEVSISFCKN